MKTAIPFIPGNYSVYEGLLSRYLPPTPKDIVQSWLRENVAPGDWVIDPFAISPFVSIEAASAGYRVLAVVNNPITRFLLELNASPLREEELRNALAMLGMSRFGEQRLEPFIKDLYATTCDKCGKKVIAEAFLWDRESPVPFARIYHCDSCGDEGEHVVTRNDMEQAERFRQSKLHQARALELIAPPNDPYRPYAQDALSTYLPRAIYALFTIKNKMDSLKSTYKDWITGQRCLNALFLHALDQANTLWAYPSGRARPRQITSPPRYRENNVWFALEKAIESLTTNKSTTPLFRYPQAPPPSGGITIFEGRLKDLVEAMKSSPLENICVRAIVSAIPRYNPAFYTLSALWAGWLWGRHAVSPFKSALRRRRYDWAWYTNALYVALKNLTILVQPDTPFYGLIGENEPSFFASVLIATTLAGFHLQGVASRVEKEQAQVHWKRNQIEYRPSTNTGKPIQLEEMISQSAITYLHERGEPAPYPLLHAAAVCDISLAKLFPSVSDQSPAHTYVQTQENIEKVLMRHSGLVRYGGSEKSPEVGLWWLKEPSAQRTSEPLSDRIERLVLDYLHTHPICSIYELDNWLCKRIPGLLTPDIEIIKACLESYGQPDLTKNEVWHLRQEDEEQMRRADVNRTKKLLKQIGLRLGFITTGDHPITWIDATSSSVTYTFFVTSTAILGSIVFSHQVPPPQAHIVIPGGRVNLVFYKIHHNPHLQQRLMEGWHFLKFRHLRRLVDDPTITPQNLSELLRLDPLTDSTHQMRLL